MVVRLVFATITSVLVAACGSGGSSNSSAEVAAMQPPIDDEGEQSNIPVDDQAEQQFPPISDSVGADSDLLLGTWVFCSDVEEQGLSVYFAYTFEETRFRNISRIHNMLRCAGDPEGDNVIRAGSYNLGGETVDSSGVPIWPIDFFIDTDMDGPATRTEYGIVSVPMNGQIFFTRGRRPTNPADRPTDLFFGLFYAKSL